ncbi:MAG: SagB/ThcOx family dehydrogenase [Candidatus Zixiibacteriota bacterium]
MANEIGKEFIERTKYRYVDESDQSRGAPQPPLQRGNAQGLPVIDLPKPSSINIPASDLRNVIDQRRTLRTFSKEPLTLGELSYLLWCTQGVQKVVEPGGIQAGRTLRTVPSGGARHAFETYLIVHNVDGLAPGVYRFLAIEHKLVEIGKSDEAAAVFAQACAGQTWMKESAVIFAWVADVYRMTWRYPQRGYRFMFLDAGHVCQNLYLAAESIGSGACAIAAYEDDEVNEFLKLDGIEQFVIYIATVGKKR